LVARCAFAYEQSFFVEASSWTELEVKLLVYGIDEQRWSAGSRMTIDQ
jgi:hypothetical protein